MIKEYDVLLSVLPQSEVIFLQSTVVRQTGGKDGRKVKLWLLVRKLGEKKTRNFRGQIIMSLLKLCSALNMGD